MRLETDRLILRPWEERDRAPYAAFNADPAVRRYFYPETVTDAEIDAAIEGMRAALAADGFSFLVCERKADGIMVGECGLHRLEDEVKAAMARPCDIELGWFFGSQYWGHGYATEAAGAWLRHSFDILDLPEVCSITQAQNAASIRVMERLGMSRDPQADFEDPTVPVGHWQRPHVIYRIVNPASRQ
jgi:RimJ/RimL family protein N-acetyltransferase